MGIAISALPAIASLAVEDVCPVVDDSSSSTKQATFQQVVDLVGSSFTDDIFRVRGSVDNTKQVALEVDGVSTATTRTRFIVDEDANDGQSWEVKNLTIVVTVGASALTCAVKTKNGTDPSTTNPIIFKFRNATLSTGDYTTIALTAALSVVGSSGSTFGTSSGVPHKLYLGVANDAGTLRLFLYNSLNGVTLSLVGISEDALYSSTAEGGIGAADSAQALYSGTAFTNKAVRLLGYIESTQATAGTWATAPSKIQPLWAGLPRTGAVIQTKRASSSTLFNATTTVPWDDTIPQNTEGDELSALNVPITPTSSANLISSNIRLQASHNTATAQFIGALFQDAVANALSGAVVTNTNGGDQALQFTLDYVFQAVTSSTTTLKIRVGPSTAAGGQVNINGVSGTRKLGGVEVSIHTVQEICT